MQNPFRDGGPLDRGTTVVSLLISIGFLITGIRTYGHGGSLGWPLGAALMVVISLRAVHREFFRRPRDQS